MFSSNLGYKAMAKVDVFTLEISKAMAKVDVLENIDVLEEIARRIKLSEDFVAFSGVGRLWRSAASKENFRFRSSLVPWLMLPPKQEGSDVRSFFSLSKGMSRQINSPDANGNKCYSSRGWLMVINRDWSLYLLHPFSSLRIELPHIKTFHDWEPNYVSLESMEIFFIEKCVLSTSPSLESDYTLVVIYGSTVKLAYFRPGLKTWITIDSCQHSYFDVIYYQEQFYALDVVGGITAIDIKSDNTVVAKQVANLPNGLLLNEFKMKLYLVESAGKLLVVARNGVYFRDEVRSIGEEPIGEGYSHTYVTYGATAFRVLEVDLSSNKWSQVKNLGNRSLFLGDNSSLSVEVLDISSLKPNCIYFTDDCQTSYAVVKFFPEGGGRDMGVYNLQDGSIEHIEPYFKGRSKCNLYDRITPPMWVEESL